mgnify:CR=1 FL=1
MKRLAVLNVVGLSAGLIGEQMPNLQKFAKGRCLSSFKPAFPAVTCTAQSSYVTGTGPDQHGIVANGWYHREAAEVQFWKQSNHIVKGKKIWERLREKHGNSFTCAKLFWWYNMYSSADYSITPRPMYPADGRKVFDVYTQPMGVRDEIKKDLGDFPFPSFWGPKAGIASSKWIAESAKWIEERYEPTLNLVYLPHLDYALQKVGPDHESIPKELAAIDRIIGDLIEFFSKRGVELMILSEYGISPVSEVVCPNRLFRRKGWITIKDELGLEQLDCGASKVFAVADHQVAHIYLNDPSLRDEVVELLLAQDGVDQVLDGREVFGNGVGGERAGDLIAVSNSNAWFAYYYWLDDAKAPDFARTIDIHRKPGYDPVELFIDPEKRFAKASIVKFLVKKKLGFRGLLDVIPLDPSLVKGSHGRSEVTDEEQPVFIAPESIGPISAPEQVFGAIERWFD